MECPKETCGGKLMVKHSYSITGGKTQRRECDTCLSVFMSVNVLIPQEPQHGAGALALANKVRAGKVAIKVSLEDLS